MSRFEEVAGRLLDALTSLAGTSILTALRISHSGRERLRFLTDYSVPAHLCGDVGCPEDHGSLTFWDRLRMVLTDRLPSGRL